MSFSIELKRWHWIQGNLDDAEDLCLHGIVKVCVGGREIEEECCVSASAMIFLRALTEDHKDRTHDDRGNQFCHATVTSCWRRMRNCKAWKS